MSWVGRVKVPDVRLSILLDHLIALDKVYPTSSFKLSQFKEAMGLSRRSSGPARKISEMRQFGLLVQEREGHKYIISDLGKTIVNGTISERADAIEKAIRNIPLWDQLIKVVGYKDKVEGETFGAAVKKITGVSDEELASQILNITFAYTEDISCIGKNPPFSKWSRRVGERKKTRSPQSDQSNIRSQEFIPPKKEQEREPIYLKQNKGGYNLTLDYGGFKIDVKDEPSVFIATLLLNQRKRELGLND